MANGYSRLHELSRPNIKTYQQWHSMQEEREKQIEREWVVNIRFITSYDFLRT